MSEAFRDCLVPVGDTLRAGLEAIARGGVRIALAVNPRGRLVGTLADGDVRRALLDGATLQGPLAPHVRRAFAWVGPEAGRVEALELMQAHVIEQIPVLDRSSRPVALHLMHELLGAVERPNHAVVMAGGRGTRLKPITDHVPKPMLKVAGRPILERIVLHLVSFGIRRIHLAVNHLAGVIRQHFGDGKRFGCRIEYLTEKAPLGTGGPLALLRPVPRHPLLVMNGDLVTQADLGRLLEEHAAGRHRITVGVRPYVHMIPYGCIERRGRRIVAIAEKPKLLREVNAGIYAVDAALLRRVPKGREYPITLLIEGCLERGERVGAFEVDGDWIDVGHHDTLRLAREGGRSGDGL